MVATLATILLYTASPTLPDIPDFDIVRECDRAFALPNCLEAEHASLGALRYWWPRIKPEDAKLVCIRSASEFRFMRYTHLMRCIAEVSHLPRPELASR